MKRNFPALNFILPVFKTHCLCIAAPMWVKRRYCYLFGLSGTGKTTLSADPEIDW
jgi:ATP-dependent phosphoenolpyruvate carboxykinase